MSVSFLDFMNEKIPNFCKFIKIFPEEEFDTLLAEHKDGIILYLVKNIEGLKTDMVTFEYNEITAAGDWDPLEPVPTEEEYFKAYTFRKFAESRKGDKYHSIRVAIYNQVVESFVPTIGVLLGDADMVSEPHQWLLERVGEDQDRIKLFRYLDAFHDMVASLTAEI